MADDHARSDQVTVMPEHQEEKDNLIEDVYVYMATSAYLTGYPDSRRRLICKKANKIQVTEGELYYTSRNRREM